MIDFTLPELGENITTGDVLRVLVKPGDTLTKDQPVLELETDKATIEVPSSVAGRVKDVKVKAGEKVKVGQAILSVDEAGASSGKEEAKPEAKAAGVQRGKKDETRQAAAPEPREEEAVAADTRAVSAERGRGVRAPGVDVRGVGAPGVDTDRGEGAAARQRQTADKPGSKAPAPDKVVDISRGARPAAEPAPDMPAAPAAPSVRRLARELGVDVNDVVGSGPSGHISVDDVKAHAKRQMGGSAARASGAPVSPAGGAALPDFSRWGEIERQPLRAVRRKTAEHLTAAWVTIPHVTHHDLADITSLEELRTRYAKQAEAAGGALTITAIAAKVVAAALRVFPQFNASIDLAADEMILKKYVNIGVAVDTDRGLLVPVIREADAKNIIQLSVELSQLAEKARTRKITLDEMQGGTFSISNLGGIGGTGFSPIVNAPEVAILGISRARTEPVYRSNELVPRLMLPISLSYDHRAIDGADAARFLRWVAEALEQPFLLALQG